MSTAPSAARLHDIAIIGAGPAGVTLANLLGAAGLDVLVLDREAGIYPLPRAIHFDGEVMRALQATGLRPQIEPIVRAGLKGMRFVNADGATLLVRGGTTAQGPHGCASNYYFHQPELEAVLRAGVTRYPSVTVRLGHEVRALTEAADGVTLEVLDRNTGALQTARARWVVGCDGARSFVRQTIGSAMQDLGLRQQWVVFDVILNDQAPELWDHTVQLCIPERPMTFCNVTGRRRRWEIMVMPGDDPEALLQPEHLWALVARWMKPEHATLERAVIYTFQSLIAKTWRRGRLLLAGDAAHQTPPFLGQGMCAAIRDSANLAWKLEAVVRGTASDQLLDTYQTERAPHVHDFIDLAVRLGDIIQTTDPQAARERDARFLSGTPTEFEFPAPRLGTGLWQGSEPVIGRPFPQPRLDDGRLLDEVVGYRSVVIARAALLDQVPQATRDVWQDSGIAVLVASDPPLASWLDAQQTDAVIVRPDRYVLGLARSVAQLVELAALLPAKAV